MEEGQAPIWALLAVSLASTYYFAMGTVLSGGSLDAAPSLPLFISLVTFLFTPFVVGSLVIPVSATRTRDPTLRSHFKWYSVLLVVLLLTVSVAVVTIVQMSVTGYIDITRTLLQAQNPAANIGFFGTILLGGYSLYRSAKSLAPLNRLDSHHEG